MADPRYELAVTMIGIGNLISIGVRLLVFDINNIILIWQSVQVGINAFFFIEMIVDLLIHGRKSYKRSFRIWPETICQIINIVATTNYFIHFNKLRKLPTGNTLINGYDPLT